MQELMDKTAVITGGASGIGLALARACTEAGMRVIIADIEPGPLDAACDELTAMGVVTDVTSPESVAELARVVERDAGGCHLLFNNAGVGGAGRLDEQTLNDWNWLIDVNLKGVVHVLHSFLPMMLGSGQPGHIVNTASVAGLGAFVSGPYTATKYAVVGISETLRHELEGTNVQVSVLCPGFVRTNIVQSERNRPATLTNDSAGPRSRAMALKGHRPKVVDPPEIAAITMQAVLEDRFWIITDPEVLGVALPRYDELRTIITGG